MNAVLTEVPPKVQPAPMSAKDAVALRERLRDAGWAPLETSTDWRSEKLGTNVAGAVRPVIYIREFKAVLGGAIAWYHTDGDVEIPDEAQFTEAYIATESKHGHSRWELLS